MWGDGPGDVGLQAGDDGEYAGQVPDVAAAAVECIALYTGIAVSQRRRIVYMNGL